MKMFNIEERKELCKFVCFNINKIFVIYLIVVFVLVFMDCILICCLDKILILFGEKKLFEFFEGWLCDVREGILLFNIFCNNCKVFKLNFVEVGCSIGIFLMVNLGFVGFFVELRKKMYIFECGFFIVCYVVINDFDKFY